MGLKLKNPYPKSVSFEYAFVPINNKHKIADIHLKYLS